MIQRGSLAGDAMNELPSKITPDAIREALFEVRFDHTALPEIVMGQLASASQWNGFTGTRMSSGDVPEQIREAEPALRYLPSLELRSQSGEVVRIGRNSLSYHVTGDYIGWDAFRPKLQALASVIHSAAGEATIARLGLRYINALTLAHHVSTIHDLNLRLEIAGREPPGGLHLAFVVEDGSGLRGMVRVVTPEFAGGDLPAGTIALIDIDVAQDEPGVRITAEDFTGWIDRAHEMEKKAFFSLLKNDTIRKLTGR